jgi:hypothetical protein
VAAVIPTWRRLLVTNASGDDARKRSKKGADMSDETKPAEGATTTEGQSAPAAPEAKPRVQVAELPPDALKPRLEQERRKGREDALSELGMTPDEAKALLAEKREREEAQKSLEQRNAEEQAARKAAEASAERARAAVQRNNEALLAKLPEDRRAALADAAGDDPLEMAKQLDLLRRFGVVAQDPTPPPAETKPAEPAKPQGTAPPPNAPGPATTSPTQVDHKTNYQQIRKDNPFLAAAYGGQHAGEVYRGD